MKIRVKMEKVYSVVVDAPEFLRPLIEKGWGINLTPEREQELEDWCDKICEKEQAKFYDEEWELVE